MLARFCLRQAHLSVVLLMVMKITVIVTNITNDIRMVMRTMAMTTTVVDLLLASQFVLLLLLRSVFQFVLLLRVITMTTMITMTMATVAMVDMVAIVAMVVMVAKVTATVEVVTVIEIDFPSSITTLSA